MIRPLLTLLLVLLTAVLPHRAADPRYNVRRILAADGQPWGTVYSVMQDRRGYIWFGTSGGLDRYDGYGYRSYRYDLFNPHGLSGMRVTCLAEDSTGAIWAGTYAGGLNRLDRSTDRFTQLAHDPSDSTTISSDMIRALATDARGHVWIATTEGLDRFNPQTGRCTRFTVGVPTSLQKDRSGRMWICAVRESRGAVILRHDPRTDTFDEWIIESGTQRGYRILGERADGSMVVGYLTHSNRNIDEPGFVRLFDPRIGLTKPLTVSTGIAEADRAKYALILDGAGICWYAAIAGARSTQGFHPYYALYAEPPLAHPVATTRAATTKAPEPILTGLPLCATEDRTGTLWLGMEDGLWRVSRRGAGVTTWRHDPNDSTSLSESRIRSVYVSSRNDLWVSTDFGLNRYDRNRGTWRRYFAGDTLRGALPNNTVNVIHEGAGTALYMGTNGGLVAYDAGRDRFYNPVPRLRQPDGGVAIVWSICRDRRGYLWVGTRYAGLARCSPDGRTVEWFTHDPNDPTSILPDGIWSLLEDQHGTIWIGTEYGLCRWVPGVRGFRRYVHDRRDTTSLSGGRIWSLLEDREGSIWATSFGGGISRFDPARERFINLTVRNGLTTNAVVGMLQDNAGVYWMCTANGLLRWDRRTNHVKRYDRGDGFQGNEFTFKAFHKTVDGRIYVGGVNGLSTFVPMALRDNKHVPSIVITGFRVFDSLAVADLRDGDTVRLTYAQNFFTIDFAALSYDNPGKNRYAYQLDEVDATWVTTSSDRRFASYTDLAPGTYTFHVRGSNDDGLWNDRGVTITIIISPPWWGTWQFRLIAGVLVVLSIIVIVRVRSHIIRRHAQEKANSALQAALESQEAERQRIARDLHDGIGQLLAAASINLTRLTDALQRIDPPPEEEITIVEPLERTRWIIERTADDVRTMSHALGISTLQELGLAAAMTELLDSIATSGSMSFYRAFIGIEGRLPEHVEVGLFRIAQELIANVLRHAHATEASVQLMKEADEVRLTVEDNGRGFDVTAARHGMGLRNIAARAEVIGGTVHYDSQIGRGTTITVVVNMAPEGLIGRAFTNT